MTVACFAAFAYLRQPAPSLRNLTVVPYLIRSLLFATTTVLLILAFSTSPSLNHTYTIFMLHIGAAYVIARLPLPLREPLTKGKLWDWPFALAIVVLLIGIYLYHFVAAEPDPDPEVAAAGFRATVYAAMAAISFAASNIMATVFEREKVQGVEGRAKFAGSDVPRFNRRPDRGAGHCRPAPGAGGTGLVLSFPFSPSRSRFCFGPLSRQRSIFPHTPC